MCATMFLVDWPKKNVFYLIVYSKIGKKKKTISDGKWDWFLDFWTAGWSEAGMGYRRYNWKLVASKLWATSVPICTATHHKTKGAQKIIPGTAARKRYG